MVQTQCLNCPIPEGWPQVTDEQWARVAPHLPQGAGRRAEATRRQFDGMLYALESGCPWHLLPPQFGPPGTAEKRFRRWAADGVLRRAYAALYPPEALAKGRTIIIDGSFAKLHADGLGPARGSRESFVPVRVRNNVRSNGLRIAR